MHQSKISITLRVLGAGSGLLIGSAGLLCDG